MSREFWGEALQAIAIAILSTGASIMTARLLGVGEDGEGCSGDCSGEDADAQCLCPLCGGEGSIPAGAKIIVLQADSTEE